MYARWLIGAESLTVAVFLCCASISECSQWEGPVLGLDGPPETELHFIWRLRAREVLLLLMVSWVAALVLAYAKTRAHRIDHAAAKYGSRFAIGTTIILPLACVLIGWVLGIEYWAFGA